MAEYIKRKSLVDLVLSKLKYIGDARIMNQNDEKVLSEIDGYEKAMEAVHELILDRDLIEDVQPVKWISVNDRLPENGEMVMCYCKTTTGEGNVYMFGTYLKEHWWLKTCRLHATLEMPQMKVMYWMPLPETPKDGEQNG